MQVVFFNNIDLNYLSSVPYFKDASFIEPDCNLDYEKEGLYAVFSSSSYTEVINSILNLPSDRYKALNENDGRMVKNIFEEKYWGDYDSLSFFDYEEEELVCVNLKVFVGYLYHWLVRNGR